MYPLKPKSLEKEAHIFCADAHRVEEGREFGGHHRLKTLTAQQPIHATFKDHGIPSHWWFGDARTLRQTDSNPGPMILRPEKLKQNIW